MQNDTLRDRIAAVIADYLRGELNWGDDLAPYLADAVIRELDLGIPCAANGCKVRRIARYHAEASSKLETPND